MGEEPHLKAVDRGKLLNLCAVLAICVALKISPQAHIMHTVPEFISGNRLILIKSKVLH